MPLPSSSPRESDKHAENSVPVYRVLVAEDNPADVMILEEILLQQRDVKFEMAIASDGQQAIQLVNSLDRDRSMPTFDIALVDLNLPKHTGHEVLATIRETERSRDIPVIIVTSSRSPNDIKRARDLGATEYFEKVPDLDAYSALGPLVVRTLQKHS